MTPNLYAPPLCVMVLVCLEDLVRGVRLVRLFVGRLTYVERLVRLDPVLVLHARLLFDGTSDLKEVKVKGENSIGN